MTATLQGCRRVASVIGCGVRVLVVAAAVAVVAATVALAQQSWEATVATEIPPPKRGTVPWAAKVAATAKPAPVPAPTPETVELPTGQSAPEMAAKTVPPSRAKLETGSIKGTAAEEYCANIANPAADARFAWHKKMLADMEQEIAKRIVLLEEKTAEYQKWLARRDEFSKKASETVLRIYARMRPDAAAMQLAALDEETAASVLTKLEPRTASLILNEMDPNQAVRLTATISGAGKVIPVAPPKAAAEAKPK